MERFYREIWEVFKVWWGLVVGLAFGVVAILKALQSGHHSVWFWAFWAMTALAFGLGSRLWQVRRERDGARKDDRNDLAVWLDNKSNDMLAFKQRLREEIERNSQFRAERAQIIEELFWDANTDVVKRLHIDAPEWLDYYSENPPNFSRYVTRTLPAQFEEVIGAIDYTVSQILRVRANLKRP